MFGRCTPLTTEPLAQRIDLGRYIVVSIWFGCNNNCRICMLAGMKSQMPPIGLERFKDLLDQIRAEGRFDRLILSGAEVTTCDALEQYAACAAASGWFQKIQIQTNGRRLAEGNYLRRLAASGINEFFVSIHGPEQVHDAMVGCRGAFGQTLQGLDNLEALAVNVISNTVLTRANVAGIPALMSLLGSRRIGEHHLWNYFPMEGSDTKDMVVDLGTLNQLLPKMVDALDRSGRPLVLKGFPECLPVGGPVVIDSTFPQTCLPDRFWTAFGENGFGFCPHRPGCRAGHCWGLSSAYVNRYGDERNLLRPF